jgi:NADPH2:quinone reductase
MRALLIQEFGPVGSHSIVERDMPVPGPNEVRIRTKAIGLTYPDLLMLQGKYQVRPELPFIPGRDAAGYVDAVGPDVESFRAGDRVSCQVARGAFAERVIAPVDRCFAMPMGASFVESAAMVTPYHTAYVAVAIRAKLHASHSILVTGATGSVGTAILQLAKALGAHVIAAVTSEERAGFAKFHGADAVVYARGDNLKENLRDQVLAANDGREVDVVFDTVGGEVFTAALRVLGFDGKMVVIGFSSMQISEARCNYILYKNLSIIGSPLDIHFSQRPDLMREAVANLRTLHESGKIKPSIAKVIPFSDIAEAFRLAADRTLQGRVVVEVE